MQYNINFGEEYFAGQVFKCGIPWSDFKITYFALQLSRALNYQHPQVRN